MKHDTGGSPHIDGTEMLKFLDIVPFFRVRSSSFNRKLTLGFDLLTVIIGIEVGLLYKSTSNTSRTICSVLTLLIALKVKFVEDYLIWAIIDCLQ